MMVIIPCIAEIAASGTPERVKKLRFGAVSELQRYLHYYRQLGYMPKLLYAIADKKCRMIGSATTKAEMQKLIRPNCPHYDGAGNPVSRSYISSFSHGKEDKAIGNKVLLSLNWMC